MEDEIGVGRQQIEMAAKCLSHAAFDAIAFVRFTNDFADGEANAGAGWASARWLKFRLRREKPAHRRGLALAACGVCGLIVRMLAQACAGQCLLTIRSGLARSERNLCREIG